MDFLEEALVPVVALMLMTQINQQQAQAYNNKGLSNRHGGLFCWAEDSSVLCRLGRIAMKAARCVLKGSLLGNGEWWLNALEAVYMKELMTTFKAVGNLAS